MVHNYFNISIVASVGQCSSEPLLVSESYQEARQIDSALYYRHAGLCLFNTIEILNHITNGLYSHVYSSTKICNIAAYFYNVHVYKDYYIGDICRVEFKSEIDDVVIETLPITDARLQLS